MFRLFALALPVCFLAVSSNAQRPMPSSPPPTPTRTPPTNDRNTDAKEEKPRKETSALAVNGNVTLSDGTPPAQLVLIERVCKGVAQRAGFADSKGRFTIDPSTLSSAPLSEAGLSPTDLQTCELRARLAGYRSQPLPFGSGSASKLGTITLQAIGNAPGATKSAADEQAPKNARKAFERGLDMAAKTKWQEAIDAFTKATSTYAQYPSAWVAFALLQEGSGQQDAAAKSLDQAVAADPKFASPYIEIADLAVQTSNWERAEEYSKKAIALGPDSFARAYMLANLSEVHLKRYDDAIESGKKGIALDSDHSYPELEFNTAVALLAQAKHEEAASHLQAYLDAAPNGADAKRAKEQLALYHPNK